MYGNWTRIKKCISVCRKNGEIICFSLLHWVSIRTVLSKAIIHSYLQTYYNNPILSFPLRDRHRRDWLFYKLFMLYIPNAICIRWKHEHSNKYTTLYIRSWYLLLNVFENYNFFINDRQKIQINVIWRSKKWSASGVHLSCATVSNYKYRS